MFRVLAAFLSVNWLAGFAVMRIKGPAIHVLLAIAIVSLVVHLARDKRMTAVHSSRPSSHSDGYV
jgi:Family of unknown function (DUF5670)